MPHETLKLSDYELGYLLAFAQGEVRFEKYRCNAYWIDPDETRWFGIQIDDRMFDVAISVDEDAPSHADNITAEIFECFKNKSDEWQASTNKSFVLQFVG